MHYIYIYKELMHYIREGFLRFQILQPAQLIRHVTVLKSLTVECSVHCACVTLCAVSHVTLPQGFLMYSACNPKDNYDTCLSVFLVQFNGFMSLKISLMLCTDINITETTYSCQF